ncbi:MAG: phosphodiesterase [Alphaproteobacteria bacterium]|nr:phosphodiesterase [Alphaproteobacteria bacterium]NNF24753.1 phosphodiesterase [Paracoccaceae bacterium]
MKTPLAPGFGARPFSHRGLHDRKAGRPENSPAAIRAAVAAGYGIEIDIQASADGQAIVFHDYDLERLTGQAGEVRQRTADELGQITLIGGSDAVPTLRECLDIVAGAVPLLIEIKDQDGKMGANVGVLEEAVAKALTGYDGPVALMSSNPHSVAALSTLAPKLPRGLTTSAYSAKGWPKLPDDARDKLRGIPDFAHTGSVFISHEAADLDRPRVAALKSQGAAIFCWTIRSAAQEDLARRVADQITFEGYLPPTPTP